jgi:hypothetical protein
MVQGEGPGTGMLPYTPDPGEATGLQIRLHYRKTPFAPAPAGG